MGFFDSLFGSNSKSDHSRRGVIDYGGQKNDGSHDHRTNKGDDRTPAQQTGDSSRRGPRDK